jgi:hypothetical protein
VSAITDIIAGAVAGLGDTAVKIRTAITGIDPSKAAEVQELTLNLQAQAAKLEADANTAQTQIDNTEASSTNWFVASWRPLIGYICSAAFFLQYVLQPIINWCGGNLSAIDMSVPTQIVIGMLGLGNVVSRTVEKVTGTSQNH